MRIDRPVTHPGPQDTWWEESYSAITRELAFDALREQRRPLRGPGRDRGVPDPAPAAHKKER